MRSFVRASSEKADTRIGLTIDEFERQYSRQSDIPEHVFHKLEKKEDETAPYACQYGSGIPFFPALIDLRTSLPFRRSARNK